MWDSATVVLGGFGLIAAIIVLVVGVKSPRKPFRSCAAKRGIASERVD